MLESNQQLASSVALAATVLRARPCATATQSILARSRLGAFMKKRFSEETMVGILRKGSTGGETIGEECRRHGFRERMVYGVRRITCKPKTELVMVG